MKPLLTIPEVAARLGSTQHLVRRLIGDGRLPACKIGRWRVDPDDLEAFIQQSKHVPPPPLERPRQAHGVPPCVNNPFR